MHGPPFAHGLQLLPGLVQHVVQPAESGAQLERGGIFPYALIQVEQIILRFLKLVDKLDGRRPVFHFTAQHLQAGLAALQSIAAFVGQPGAYLPDRREALGLQGAGLRVLQCRHVSDKAGKKPVLARHFTHGQLERKFGAVLAPAHRLKDLAAFFWPFLGLGNPGGMAGLCWLERGHEQRQLFPGHFSGRVAEHLFRRLVGRQYVLVVIQRDDALGGGIHNSAEARLAFAQRGFVAFAFRDIFQGKQNERRLVALLTDPAGIEQERAVAQAGKFVVNLKVMKLAILANDRFEQRPQAGNLPLALAQLVDQPVLGILRIDAKSLIKRTVRPLHAHLGIEHDQRLTHRVHDCLSEIARLLDHLLAALQRVDILHNNHGAVNFVLCGAIRANR